ncbi:hypothetical protein PAJ34TS1_40400 [Paenibacillus azoreducens]|uniref:Uncharacterized protein n=1 Tax=Paenibacillus azoreducens TaxID=116718 RepID=A0A920CLZ3_9BACL|nr:hypothetical protein J34TS1_04210 [Paenibacillus azoreducens]
MMMQLRLARKEQQIDAYGNCVQSHGMPDRPIDQLAEQVPRQLLSINVGRIRPQNETGLRLPWNLLILAGLSDAQLHAIRIRPNYGINRSLDADASEADPIPQPSL